MNNLYKTIRIEAIFLSGFLIFLCVGCGATSPGKLSTPSGRPQVMIPNANIQNVMDEVAAWFALQGMPITGNSTYTISITVTKNYDNTNSDTSNWRTAPYQPTINKVYSAVLTIVPDIGNTMVYESRYDLINNAELNSQPDYEDIQKELLQIANFIKTRSNPEVTK